MILTGRQIREGRALVGLSQAELAAAADVAVTLIVRVETVDDMAMMRKADTRAVRSALEAAGVEFIHKDNGSAGVHLRRADKGEAV